MVEIRRDMSGVVERGELYLYVVKLVPQLATRQLPNFRMRCAADVDRVSATLRAMSLGSFAEVWWCRTRVDRSVTSVGGRLRLGTGDVCLEQVIEQVWFESPRVLETRADDILVPRFRGTRPSWGWRWRVVEMYTGQGGMICEGRLLRDIREATMALERLKDPLHEFSEKLGECGVHEVTIEYKYVDGDLRVIDWDTRDDSVILERME